MPCKKCYNNNYCYCYCYRYRCTEGGQIFALQVAGNSAGNERINPSSPIAG